MERHTLPETRFDYGGDEFIFAEVSVEMSLEANFKVLAVTQELAKQKIPGVTEICPANASYMVRYKPEIIHPDRLIEEIRAIDRVKSNISDLTLESRIVEIPIWYDDPYTKECAAKFASRHQDPEVTNLEYMMRINGFSSKEEFIAAHSGVPYWVSMVGFVPGTAWTFAMCEQDKVMEAPKYLRPRTETPARAFSHGGAFAVIYPVAGPGGYQLLGMSAVPVYDPEGKLKDLKESLILAKAGDIWKYRSIDEKEYNRIVEQVDSGEYRYKITNIQFRTKEYFANPDGYLKELLGGIR